VVTDDQGEEISRRVLPPEGIAGRALADGRLHQVLGEVETQRVAEIAEAAENRDELERLRRRDAGHRAMLEQERTTRQQAEAERASLAAKLADKQAELDQMRAKRGRATAERRQSALPAAQRQQELDAGEPRKRARRPRR